LPWRYDTELGIANSLHASEITSVIKKVWSDHKALKLNVKPLAQEARAFYRTQHTRVTKIHLYTLYV